MNSKWVIIWSFVVGMGLGAIGTSLVTDPTFKAYRGAHIHMVDKNVGGADRFVGWADPMWYGWYGVWGDRLHTSLETHVCDGFFVDNAGYGVESIISLLKE